MLSGRTLPPETARLPPARRALLCLLAAGALTGGLLLATPEAGGAMQWAWLHGGIAAAMGWAAALPWWWLPMLLACAPAALFATTLDLPAVLWLLGAGGLFLVFRGAIHDRVPLFLSDDEAVSALLGLLPDDRPISFADLGCGTGTVLRAVRAKRPIARLYGVENALLTYLLAAWNLREAAVGLRLGTLWDTRLGDYDIVYAFLSPAAMPRIWQQAQQQMRPGTLLISNSFAVPGVAVEDEIPLQGRFSERLLVYRIGHTGEPPA